MGDAPRKATQTHNTAYTQVINQLSTPSENDSPKKRQRLTSQFILTLTVLTAVMLFVVARIAVGTYQQQVRSTLTLDGQSANDYFNRQEDIHLNTLDSITTSETLLNSISATSGPQPRAFLEAQARQADIDTLLLLDPTGDLTLRLDAVRSVNRNEIENFQSTSGGSYAGYPVVASVIEQRIDERAGRFTGLVETPSGPMLVTSAPVTSVGQDTEVRLVGIIVVGTSLDRILSGFSEDLQADVLLLVPPAELLASTLPDWRDINTSQLQAGTESGYASIATSDGTITDTVSHDGRTYQLLYTPLSIRGQTLGILALAQPLIGVLATGDQTLIAIGIAAFGSLIMLISLNITQRVLAPLAELIAISRRVSGRAGKRENLSADELRELLNTVNEMMQELREKTSALEEENAKSNAILESIVDGVIVRDPEGNIILTNQATRSLLTFEGQYKPEVISTHIPPNTTHSGPQRLKTENRVLSVSVALVAAPGIRDVLVLRDITSEEMASRTKDNFLNQISHELRTPLTSLQGFASILRDRGEDMTPDSRKKAAHSIFQQARILNQMIGQMIDLTAIQEGDISLHLEPLDIVDLVKARVTELRETRPVAITVRTEPDHIVVLADQRRIRRAVSALILNALHYTPSDGSIIIAISKNGEHALLSVRDTGVGISSEDLPHIFERFYRGTPTDRYGNLVDVRGMGQGLYIVKSIVHAHNGRVEVESEKGLGSTFRVYLPLLQKQPTSGTH